VILVAGRAVKAKLQAIAEHKHDKVSDMATETKEMWVANLVESWRGDQSSVPVYEFFESIDEAAELGRLSAKDKLRLARLRLRGIAKAFYFTQPELKGDEIEYDDFKAAFIQRFKDKQTDQYNYTRL
jgi:hypothetical protein